MVVRRESNQGNNLGLISPDLLVRGGRGSIKRLQGNEINSIAAGKGSRELWSGPLMTLTNFQRKKYQLESSVQT